MNVKWVLSAKKHESCLIMMIMMTADRETVRILWDVKKKCVFKKNI